MTNGLSSPQSVSCLVDSEIVLVELGALLSALQASEHALGEVDYFDLNWAYGVPGAPIDRRPPRTDDRYVRIVAVRDERYIGFLAGRVGKSTAFITLIEVLEPGGGTGPILLEEFSQLATNAGCSRVRLKPEHDDRYNDRVRFFMQNSFRWCPGDDGFLCKDLPQPDECDSGKTQT